MSLHKFSELKSFLDSFGLHPKKGLSQNFLIDLNIVNKLLQTAKIKEDDIVLEIGPGPGVITESLLKTGAEVIAVETDQKFAEALLRFESPKLNLVIDDFLDLDLGKILHPYLSANRKIKVVANIPFQITSPILEKLFRACSYFDSFTLIVQKEAAQRFTSKPSSKLYGYLSVLTNFFSHCKVAHIISPASFYPKPKIHSAILECNLKNIDPTLDIDTFCNFIKICFRHKRKLLLNSLKLEFSDEAITSAYKTSNLKATTRPSDLSSSEYLTLYRALYENFS